MPDYVSVVILAFVLLVGYQSMSPQTAIASTVLAWSIKQETFASRPTTAIVTKH